MTVAVPLRPLPDRLAMLRAALPGSGVVTGGARRYILFLSWTDGSHRAEALTAVGASADEAWARGACELAGRADNPAWLRADWVDAVEKTNWASLRARLAETKRGYFRLGLALDADFSHAFLETEINANAMLYGGPREWHASLNERNFTAYAAKRHGVPLADFADERAVWLFLTKGAFIEGDGAFHRIDGQGLDAGRRALPDRDPDAILGLIERGSRYLATQVGADGRFVYGWHPCFDRPIATYNGLRHASTLYAMLEAWEVTRDPDLAAAIDRALLYLTDALIRPVLLAANAPGAALVEPDGEIKLGGNAVAILALVKYAELHGDARLIPLCEALAATILDMQDPASGRFVHVRTYPSLATKARFRTIYYDGEAAFALMRLYDRTQNPDLLAAVERAFAHFAEAKHWQAHDHWLGYAANELTRHRPDAAWYDFGLANVRDHLDFVIERITTFPTLLELMTAAEKMIARLRADPEHSHRLSTIDLPRFYKALHARAHYLANGHFWPELAMYFAAPAKMAGSFFIRHHGFRVRIDDVEHYLSGLIAYRAYLIASRDGERVERESAAKDAGHWNAADVLRATGGRWEDTPAADWSAGGLAIYAPAFRAGDMIAVRAADSPRGVPLNQVEAFGAAPAALIVAEGEARRLPQGGPARLRVADVDAAVLDLGAYARGRMRGTLFGVTGSAGKTSLAAMLSHALAPFGAVGGTRHNANLPAGIAWNLASIAWQTPHIVLELAIGRMAQNTRLARPDIAIFTNIAAAHLEHHRDLPTVAARKSRIFGGMARGGTAVLNREMAEWARVHMAAKLAGLIVVHYGTSAGCEYRLIDYEAATGVVHAEVHGRAVTYRIGARGAHMALNSLAVLAGVAAAGNDLGPAIERLADFEALAGRGAESELIVSGQRIALIDDAYNANPASMAAAVAALGGRAARGRKILLLGEMLELGGEARAYHFALAAHVEANGIDRVHAAGDLYCDFWAALSAARRGIFAKTADELADAILPELREGDVLLVKGSHGSRMHHLVDRLKSAAERANCQADQVKEAV